MDVEYAYWMAPSINLPQRKLMLLAMKAEGFPIRKLRWRLKSLRSKAYYERLELGSSIAPLVYLAQSHPDAFLATIEYWVSCQNYSNSFRVDSFRRRLPNGMTEIGSAPFDLLSSLRCVERGGGVSVEVNAGVLLGMSEEQAVAAASIRGEGWLETPMLCIAVAHLDASVESLKRASEVFGMLTSHKVEKDWRGGLGGGINSSLDGLTIKDAPHGDFYQLFEPSLIRDITEQFAAAGADTDNVLAWQILTRLMPDLTVPHMLFFEKNRVGLVAVYKNWYAGFSADSIVTLLENGIDLDLGTNVFPHRDGVEFDLSDISDRLLVEFRSREEIEDEDGRAFDETIRKVFS